jgi:hypothetical protein
MKKSIAWAVACAILLLGHPLALAMAYVLCLAAGLITRTGTNVIRVQTLPFLAMAWAVGWLRWTWFRHRTGKASPGLRLRAFALANLPALPGLALTAMLLSPLEGNGIGFFLVPAWLLLMATSAPLIWFLTRRLGTRLQS